MQHQPGAVNQQSYQTREGRDWKHLMWRLRPPSVPAWLHRSAGGMNGDRLLKPTKYAVHCTQAEKGKSLSLSLEQELPGPNVHVVLLQRDPVLLNAFSWFLFFFTTTKPQHFSFLAHNLRSFITTTHQPALMKHFTHSKIFCRPHC